MAEGQADADGRARDLNAGTAPRDARIDALRALALAGILQVNIQSFAWGGGNPLGYFVDEPGSAARTVMALLAVFVQFKFLPIFALLFGAGIALMADGVAARGMASAPVLTRRMRWLLLFGLLHGTLLYYGDITNFYAGVGLIVVALYHDANAARLRRALVRWALAALAAILVAGLLNAYWMRDVESRTQAAVDLLNARETYTTGDLGAQLALRVNDFLGGVAGFWFIGQWTVVLTLMLAGMVAARRGWLQAPQAHPRVVRGALLLGLGVGLPCAVAYAWLAPVQTLAEFVEAAPRPAADLLLNLGGLLGFAYVAAFLRWAPAAVVRALAPAGRMPLTNYLMQSIAMGVLLSGWGLGWGQSLGTLSLAVLALGIAVLQWMLGAWVIARWGQGPLEALWRRLTYGQAA